LLYHNVFQGGQWNTVFRFTGQEYDAEYALYNYNARLYDPIMGRFISPDPVIQDPYNPQNLNRYAYCLNNPLIYVDPTGNESSYGSYTGSVGYGGWGGYSGTGASFSDWAASKTSGNNWDGSDGSEGSGSSNTTESVQETETETAIEETTQQNKDNTLSPSEDSGRTTTPPSEDSGRTTTPPSEDSECKTTWQECVPECREVLSLPPSTLPPAASLAYDALVAYWCMGSCYISPCMYDNAESPWY
jgi:RHS repeat-associated protein